MADLNLVVLVGRLTRDPELRYTQGGSPLCKIGMAVETHYGKGDDRKKETLFINVTLWGRQAEVASSSLKKGAPILVEGRLKLNSWEGPAGEKRSQVEVTGERFQFLTPPPQRGDSYTHEGQDDTSQAQSGRDPDSEGVNGPNW